MGRLDVAHLAIAEHSRDFDMARFLITLGIVLVVLGLLWPIVQKIGLGRLPGDIVIERENVRFYLPITTSLLLSGALTLLFWFINRLH